MAKKTAKAARRKRATGDAKVTMEQTGRRKPTGVPLATTAGTVVRNGKKTRAAIAEAGKTLTQDGRAMLSKTQKIKDLTAAPGTKFYDKNGKLVSAEKASTKKGNLKSGHLAVRKGPGGRENILVGGGQNG